MLCLGCVAPVPTNSQIAAVNLGVTVAFSILLFAHNNSTGEPFLPAH